MRRGEMRWCVASMAIVLLLPSVAFAQSDDESCGFVRCPAGAHHATAGAALATGVTFEPEAVERADVDGNGRADMLVELADPDGHPAKVVILSFNDGWAAHVVVRVPENSLNLDDLPRVGAAGRVFLPFRWWGLVRPGSSRQRPTRLVIYTATANGVVPAFEQQGAPGEAFTVSAGPGGSVVVRRGRRPAQTLRWNDTTRRLTP